MKRPTLPSRGITYLRGVVEDNMVDAIRVVRPNVPIYDRASGYAVGVSSETGYTGKAHVHQTTPSGTITLGEGMQAMSVLTITIPFDASPVPRVEDHVVITALGSFNDQTLTNETLRIINVSGGGIGFITRELTCTLQQANPYDPGA